ncbi:hypothetical protein AUP68_10627 [Ilyonectria robusta]
MDGAATCPLRLVRKWVQSLTKPMSIPQLEALTLWSPPSGILVPDSLSMSPIVDIEPIAYGWDRELEYQTNGNADMSSRAGCLGTEEYFCYWRADGGSSSGAMSSSRPVPLMHLDCRSGQGIRTPGVDAKYARLLAWCYKTRVPMIVAVPTILFWIFLIQFTGAIQINTARFKGRIILVVNPQTPVVD